MIFAGSWVPSASVTLTDCASFTTWLLVTTVPSASMMKPEPRASTACGRFGRCGPNGVGISSSSAGWLRSSVVMETTAGFTRLTRSAKSGRARAGAAGAICGGGIGGGKGEMPGGEAGEGAAGEQGGGQAGAEAAPEGARVGAGTWGGSVWGDESAATAARTARRWAENGVRCPTSRFRRDEIQFICVNCNLWVTLSDPPGDRASSTSLHPHPPAAISPPSFARRACVGMPGRDACAPQAPQLRRPKCPR